MLFAILDLGIAAGPLGLRLRTEPLGGDRQEGVSAPEEGVSVLRPVIDVRPASKEDLDELVELWMRARQESAQLNHVVHAIPPVALRERLEVLLAGDGEAQVLVGRRDGHCAGFVVLRESVVSSVLDTRVLMIEYLYVHPQHRRVGLAKAMLGAASAIA